MIRRCVAVTRKRTLWATLARMQNRPHPSNANCVLFMEAHVVRVRGKGVNPESRTVTWPNGLDFDPAEFR